MPNWCSNHVTFTGSEENIKTIYDAFIKAQTEQRETSYGQHLKLHENDDHLYMFDLYTSDDIYEGMTCFAMQYSTKWSPDIDYIKYLCYKLNLKAEYEYEELGNWIYGKVTINELGEIVEHKDVPEWFFKLFVYDDNTNDYLFIPTDERFPSEYDLIDEVFYYRNFFEPTESQKLSYAIRHNEILEAEMPSEVKEQEVPIETETTRLTNELASVKKALYSLWYDVTCGNDCTESLKNAENYIK